MLHLRVVCPCEHTDSVIDLLSTDSGIAHLVVVRGVAVRPAGDLIEAAIARESAEHVLDQLTSLGVSHSGEISLHNIDTLLSRTADSVEAATPGQPADAVIWEELVATTGEESRLNGTFLAFLTLACLLAAVGVLTDSAITIVGAMVVSPDFGPLAALAVATIGNRRDLATRAGVALGVGYPVAILVTVVLAVLGRVVGIFDTAELGRLHTASFIYHIGPYSIIIALLAGTAGMLALTSEKSGILIGVFISVTTVPAAGFAALAAVAGHWVHCGEAMLQLLINLGGITVAGVLTLLVRQHRVLPDTPRNAPR
ncbi:putative hydrophobic protein (TIGR00271 family) [Actinopolyspora lacussalsi]|nr:putative hydrophobic protein (TIGR00271 family) [Actinopolyspora lacussalsi]